MTNLAVEVPVPSENAETFGLDNKDAAGCYIGLLLFVSVLFTPALFVDLNGDGALVSYARWLRSASWWLFWVVPASWVLAWFLLGVHRARVYRRLAEEALADARFALQTGNELSALGYVREARVLRRRARLTLFLCPLGGCLGPAGILFAFALTQKPPSRRTDRPGRPPAEATTGLAVSREPFNFQKACRHHWVLPPEGLPCQTCGKVERLPHGCVNCGLVACEDCYGRLPASS